MDILSIVSLTFAICTVTVGDFKLFVFAEVDDMNSYALFVGLFLPIIRSGVGM